METSEELRDRAGSGVRWMVFGRLAIQIVSLGYAMVLARLLTPSEFGVFGLAFVILHIILFVDGLRIEAAIVQLKVADEGTLTAAAIFGLMFGCSAAALLFLAAPWIARLFSVDDLAPVLRVCSVVFLVRALFLVPRALIRRRLLFRAQVVVDVVKVFAAGMLAVAAASGGLGVWALVVYFLARAVLEGIGTTIVAPWIPASRPDRSGLARLIRFGLPSSGSQLLVYSQLNLTDLFVGGIHGAAPLGFYQQSFSLMNKPIAYFDDVVNRLAFPVMARKWHLEQDLTSGYLQAFAIITAAAAPAACAAALLAPELVRVIYGMQWVASIPLLQILAPLGLLKVWQPLISAVFHARGRPMVELYINVLVVTVLATSLWTTRGNGVEAAAFVTVGASLMYAVVGHSVIIRWTDARAFLFLRRLVGPALGCLVMAAAVIAIRRGFTHFGDVIVLCVSLGAIVCLYSLVLRFADRQLFSDALAWVFPRRSID